MPTQAMTLPEEVRKLAPKREDFSSEEAYLEARASFRSRVRHLARRPSKASRKK